MICGGYDRKDDLSGLDSNISNIIKVYTYGATKERVYNYFKKKKIEVIMFETLRDATLKALNDVFYMCYYCKSLPFKKSRFDTSYQAFFS